VQAVTKDIEEALVKE